MALLPWRCRCPSLSFATAVLLALAGAMVVFVLWGHPDAAARAFSASILRPLVDRATIAAFEGGRGGPGGAAGSSGEISTVAIYVSNIKNADAVVRFGAYPVVQDVGPFVFRRHRHKFGVDVSLNAGRGREGTATFRDTLIYEFIPAESCGETNDKGNLSSGAGCRSVNQEITVVNPAYLSLQGMLRAAAAAGDETLSAAVAAATAEARVHAAATSAAMDAAKEVLGTAKKALADTKKSLNLAACKARAYLLEAGSPDRAAVVKTCERAATMIDMRATLFAKAGVEYNAAVATHHEASLGATAPFATVPLREILAKGWVDGALGWLQQYHAVNGSSNSSNSTMSKLTRTNNTAKLIRTGSSSSLVGDLINATAGLTQPNQQLVTAIMGIANQSRYEPTSTTNTYAYWPTPGQLQAEWERDGRSRCGNTTLEAVGGHRGVWRVSLGGVGRYVEADGNTTTIGVEDLDRVARDFGSLGQVDGFDYVRGRCLLAINRPAWEVRERQQQREERERKQRQQQELYAREQELKRARERNSSVNSSVLLPSATASFVKEASSLPNPFAVFVDGDVWGERVVINRSSSSSSSSRSSSNVINGESTYMDGFPFQPSLAHTAGGSLGWASSTQGDTQRAAAPGTVRMFDRDMRRTVLATRDTSRDMVARPAPSTTMTVFPSREEHPFIRTVRYTVPWNVTSKFRLLGNGNGDHATKDALMLGAVGCYADNETTRAVKCVNLSSCLADLSDSPPAPFARRFLAGILWGSPHMHECSLFELNRGKVGEQQKQQHQPAYQHLRLPLYLNQTTHNALTNGHFGLINFTTTDNTTDITTSNDTLLDRRREEKFNSYYELEPTTGTVLAFSKYSALFFRFALPVVRTNLSGANKDNDSGKGGAGTTGKETNNEVVVPMFYQKVSYANGFTDALTTSHHITHARFQLHVLPRLYFNAAVVLFIFAVALSAEPLLHYITSFWITHKDDCAEDGCCRCKGFFSSCVLLVRVVLCCGCIRSMSYRRRYDISTTKTKKKKKTKTGNVRERAAAWWKAKKQAVQKKAAQVRALDIGERAAMVGNLAKKQIAQKAAQVRALDIGERAAKVGNLAKKQIAQKAAQVRALDIGERAAKVGNLAKKQIAQRAAQVRALDIGERAAKVGKLVLGEAKDAQKEEACGEDESNGAYQPIDLTSVDRVHAFDEYDSGSAQSNRSSDAGFVTGWEREDEGHDDTVPVSASSEQSRVRSVRDSIFKSLVPPRRSEGGDGVLEAEMDRAVVEITSRAREGKLPHPPSPPSSALVVEELNDGLSFEDYQLRHMY